MLLYKIEGYEGCYCANCVEKNKIRNKLNKGAENMGLSVCEQETTVTFMRDSNICTVYTSDSTVITKLDKLASNKKAPYWKLKEIHKLQNGEVVGKTYETHKRLISFRSDIVSREMTEEQKESAAERMREWHKQRG